MLVTNGHGEFIVNRQCLAQAHDQWITRSPLPERDRPRPANAKALALLQTVALAKRVHDRGGRLRRLGWILPTVSCLSQWQITRDRASAGIGGNKRNFLKVLMRFVRSDVRDDIA